MAKIIVDYRGRLAQRGGIKHVLRDGVKVGK